MPAGMGSLPGQIANVIAVAWQWLSVFLGRRASSMTPSYECSGTRSVATSATGESIRHESFAKQPHQLEPITG